MSDESSRHRDSWGLVEQSRALCSTARATVALAKEALARSKERREKGASCLRTTAEGYEATNRK